MAYNRRVPFTHPLDEFPPPNWAMRRTDPWETFTNRPGPGGGGPSGGRGFGDQSFGDAMRDDEFFSNPPFPANRGGYYVTPPSRSNLMSRSCSSNGIGRSNGGEMQLSDTEFKVVVDVNNFKPEELDVKIVDDEVSIHGKHVEKSDVHGNVSREFTRRYKLPSDVEPADVTSSLSQDGVLSIRGPRKCNQSAEKSIPISIQGKPAVEGAASK